MKNLLLAAFAALMVAFSFTAAPAVAQDNSISSEVDVRSIRKGKWGDRKINPSVTIDQMASLLRQGHEVCHGTKMIGSCMTFNPFMQEIMIINVGRAISGVGVNHTPFRIIKASSQGFAIFNEKGEYLSLVADNGKVENAAARWTTGLAAIPAAFANGGLASLVNATLGPCANGQCGQQGPSVVNLLDVTSGSWSGTTSQQVTNVGVSGACGSAPCASAPRQ